MSQRAFDFGQSDGMPARLASYLAAMGHGPDLQPVVCIIPDSPERPPLGCHWHAEDGAWGSCRTWQEAWAQIDAHASYPTGPLTNPTLKRKRPPA